ncbi:MAG: DUF4974 domain-containing protein [Bacteroidetes bacterium]|nr:MAG: DUF4974 domain-containing protein [Bacteroidota bacterium]
MNPDSDILARWLEGRLSEAELEQLEASYDLQELKKWVEAAGELQPPPFDEKQAWQRFLSRREAEAPAVDPTAGRAFPWRWVAGLAAGLALLAMGYWLAMPSGSFQLQTQAAEHQRHTLPDGSVVLLNAESRLSYQARSWDKQRVLRLEGEAFFVVKKGSPFVVHTPQGQVQVLGTSFNVHDRGLRLEVACFTGKVQVSNSSLSDEVLLTAGEGVAIKGQDVLPLQLEVQDSLPAWSSGRFRFHQASIREVLGEVSRQFDVRVQYLGPDKIYNGGFDTHLGLEHALKMVCDPLNLAYDIKGRVVTIKVRNNAHVQHEHISE